MAAVPPVALSPAAASAEALELCAAKWAALEHAAQVVVPLAGVPPLDPLPDFAALLVKADPWRQDRAAKAVADLTAVMKPGISALLSVKAQGGDCTPAAEALLEEFSAAKDALLAVLGFVD